MINSKENLQQDKSGEELFGSCEILIKGVEMEQADEDQKFSPKENLVSKSTDEPNRNWKIFAVVAFYIVSSITTIMLNKRVLRETDLPLLFLWGQLIMAVVFLHLLSLVGLIQRTPPVSLTIFKNLLALISVNVIGLALNTICLANLDAVMYQVARSLVLPMTVAMAPFVMATWPSARILGACGIIFVGFMVGIFGDAATPKTLPTTKGIVFGVLSSLSTSIHSFVIKKSFSTSGGGVKEPGALELVYYNNLFSAILLVPLLVVFEAGQIVAFFKTSNNVEQRFFFLGIVLTGASGLLINLAGFLQIKVTSPVTHTVSSAARGVLQSIAAHLFLGEAITMARSIGIAVTLFGSALYSVCKSQEGRKT